MAGTQRKPKASQPPKSSSSLPSTFTPAPKSLAPFLALLDPSKVYLTHIDRLGPRHKQKIFLIPVVLNAVVAFLLLWRVWAATPVYLALLQTMLGFSTSETVDTTSTTRGQQFGILFKRFLMFSMDFTLFRLVGSWPLAFFYGEPANPCGWRRALGFRPEEVVVRESRGWAATELLAGPKPKFDVVMERERMKRKTGYLLMDADWNLDFQAMLDAHTLVERKEMAFREVDRVLFVHEEAEGWRTWRLENEEDVTEDRRKKVVVFKERLTALGKESLFWKWTEIVEDERGEDGGFTAEKQQRVAERVKEEFAKNGLDFDEVVQSVGGLDEVTVS